MQEAEESSFLKVLAFWAEVTCQYDARFILKADDNVYLLLHKVPMLLAQWEALEVGETSNSLLSRFHCLLSSLINSLDSAS